VQLVVDALYDLADGRRPTPQVLGPSSLASVAFRRAHDARPVGRSLGLHHPRQVQSHLLDESRLRTHAAVELRAVGQGRESVSEVALGVAVEVPLAGEPAEASEDGEGEDLAFGEGGRRAGPLFWPMRVAGVVRDDGESAVRKVSLSRAWVGSFPFGIGEQADSSSWAPSTQLPRR
jgi:hypothetical protein